MDNKPPKREMKKNSWNQLRIEGQKNPLTTGGGRMRRDTVGIRLRRKEGQKTPLGERGEIEERRQLGSDFVEKEGQQKPPLEGGEKEDDSWDQPSPKPMTLPERAMFA